MYSPDHSTYRRHEQRQDQQGLSLREKLAWSLAGIIALGGTVILVRNAIRKRQAEAEQRLTYEDGSVATYAKQVRMAFDNDGWWGTNTYMLRQIFTRIPSKQVLRQVIDSYKRLYSRSLLTDMESELQSSEYNEMLAIISGKPEQVNASLPTNVLTTAKVQGWAARLKAAFEKSYGFVPGTDEQAIRAVFTEMPTQTAFTYTAAAYKSIYGRDLTSDLKSELEFWEYHPFIQIIQQKPK